MSVNKPGLAKLNIPKKVLDSASFKTVTANKLTTSTRTGFGIMAQRSKVGTGAIFNVKQYHSESISAQRHALNDNRIQLNNNIISAPVFTHVENNGINKYAAALTAVSMLADTLNQLGGLGSLSVGGKTPAHDDNGGKVDNNSADAAALKDMKNAKDSTSLRAAIEAAESERISMNSELSQLESQLPSMKEASEAATRQLTDLEPKVKAKEAEVDKKEKNVSNKEEALAGAERDKNSALKVAQNMESAVGQAATDYTAASTALVEAEATLASTPKTKTGPDGKTQVPNEPAYSNAQRAVEDAKRQKDNAKSALDTARENHANAVKNYEAQINNYETAAQSVQTAKDELKTATGEYEKAQQELNELKKQEADANAKVKEYEDALDKQKKLTKDIEKYGTEITEQKTRLTELENKEKKELENTNSQMNSLSDKIDKRNANIDTTDGLSFMEKRKLKKNEKNSEKYEQLTDTRDELQRKMNYTDLYSDKSKAETIGTKTFRTGSYNGETLYMIGAKPVTQAEFEAEKRKAEAVNSSDLSMPGLV